MLKKIFSIISLVSNYMKSYINQISNVTDHQAMLLVHMYTWYKAVKIMSASNRPVISGSTF